MNLFCRNRLLLLIIPLLTLVFSCSARIEGSVRDGGAADLSVKTALEPRTIALIRSLRGFMGDASGKPILDGQAISRSMSSSEGIRSVSLNNTGPAALDGVIFISNVDNFLRVSGAKGRFITYTQGREPGTSSIIIQFGMDYAPEIISMLSEEVEEYLSALMAPAVTGEICTRKEYLDLVSSIYSRPLADEINAARIRASIDFPRPITSVRGGAASGNRAEFNIPLADILVLETPLRYEVSW